MCLSLEGGRKMGRELRDDWWKVSLTFNGSNEFSAVLSLPLHASYAQLVVFCI